MRIINKKFEEMSTIAKVNIMTIWRSTVSILTHSIIAMYAATVISNILCISAFAADPPVSDSAFKPFYSAGKTDSAYNYSLALLSARVAGESYNDTRSNSACVGNGPISSMYNCALLEAGFLDTQLVKYNVTSPQDPIAIAISSSQGYMPSGMSQLAQSSLQAVVGYKNISVDGHSKRVIAITFRGTQFGNPSQQFPDLAIDASAGSVQYALGDANNKVHEGFYASENAMELLENSIQISGISLGTLIANSAKAGASGDIFWVSGHSLGGGIATLYAARLLDRGINRDNLLVYTFGAPAAGNANFKDVFFNSAKLTKKINLYRFRDKNDAIPYSTYAAIIRTNVRDLANGMQDITDGNYLAASTHLKKFTTDSILDALISSVTPWPFNHIGYPITFSDGYILGDGTPPEKFTIMKEFVGTAFPHHAMTNYYWNIQVSGSNIPRSGTTQDSLLSGILTVTDTNGGFGTNTGTVMVTIPYSTPFEPLFKKTFPKTKHHQGESITYLANITSWSPQKVTANIFSDTLSDVKAIKSTIIISVNNSSYNKITEFTYPFKDISSNHWASEAISNLWGLGLVHGIGDTKNFGPKALVTRAEFLSMIIRSKAGDITAKPSVSPFDDVPLTGDGSWFAPYANYANINGYAHGTACADNNIAVCFRPNDPVSRFESSIMITNVFGLTYYDALHRPKWTDYKPETQTYSPWIAYTHGILRGLSTTHFGANDLLTRDQAVYVINAALKAKKP